MNFSMRETWNHLSKGVFALAMSISFVFTLVFGLTLPLHVNANTQSLTTATNLANLDISSQVDKSEITIGDRVQYEIKVVYPAEGHLELPSVLGNLGSFEVKDYQASEPKPAGKRQIQTWHFNLSTFTVGKYTLPPQQILYRNGTDTTSIPFFTQPIEINVVRTSPETVKDIADIAGLEEVKSGPPWLAYGLGVLILLAMGLLLWKRFRKNKVGSAEMKILSPIEEALEKLASLKDLALIRQNRAGQFSFILSELLRRYISRRFEVGALESTTTEFLEDVKKLPITKAQKEWLAKFSEAADLVKFADAGLLETEALAWLNQASDFLHQTKPNETEALQDKGPAETKGPVETKGPTPKNEGASK